MTPTEFYQDAVDQAVDNHREIESEFEDACLAYDLACEMGNPVKMIDARIQELEAARSKALSNLTFFMGKLAEYTERQRSVESAPAGEGNKICPGYKRECWIEIDADYDYCRSCDRMECEDIYQWM